MAMNATYLNAIAAKGSSLMTHILLVSEGTTELSGGTPAYSRLPVTWSTTYGDGIIRPNADLTFDVAAGSSVAGWMGASSSSGGTIYGGAFFVTPETYANQGQFKLLAADTGVTHSSS